MKRKCDKCRGRGGVWLRIGLREVWQGCFECGGRGAWFPGARPKKSKRCKE